ncbi:MAG: polysaccharide biosynthesis/export family protein [Bryobacteraceae bacterium]
MKTAIGMLLLACASVSSARAQAKGVVDNAVASVANLPAQRIATDDLLAISVYNEPELTRTIRVSADGSIRIPMLPNPLHAAGLLPPELERAAAEALEKGHVLVHPVVTVTILEYSSARTISVMGAVRHPLVFQAVGRVTLLDALARAEGVNGDAGPDVLVTHPGGAPADRINLKKLLDGQQAALNIPLTGGEDVRVPEARKIYVVGNVKRPGAFPVRDGSENTVLKLLAMAEGVAPYARKEAFIYRPAGDGQPRREIPVELKKLLSRKAPDVPVYADDILYIPDASGKRIGVTTLEKIAMYGSGAAAAVIYAGAR